jgi:ribosomal-protein-alanine N-acetyltransferase
VSLGDLILRAMTAGDVAEVAAIHVTAFRETDEGALERAIANLREELARPWARVWVACSGEQVIGAFVAWVVADEVHVLDVATHPDHRRRGVGRALVKEVLALAERERAVHVYLEVRRSNVAAIALYRGAGFAAVGIRERYYANDEDAVEMALTRGEGIRS